MSTVARHADHDPSLICRPAGNGLCEPWDGRGVLASVPEREWADIDPRCDWGGHFGCPGCGCWCHPDDQQTTGASL